MLEEKNKLRNEGLTGSRRRHRQQQHASSRAAAADLAGNVEKLAELQQQRRQRLPVGPGGKVACVLLLVIGSIAMISLFQFRGYLMAAKSRKGHRDMLPSASLRKRNGRVVTPLTQQPRSAASMPAPALQQSSESDIRMPHEPNTERSKDDSAAGVAATTIKASQDHQSDLAEAHKQLWQFWNSYLVKRGALNNDVPGLDLSGEAEVHNVVSRIIRVRNLVMEGGATNTAAAAEAAEAQVHEANHPSCIVVKEAGGVCAPSFFILGAFKAGTTSVYNYLARHPGVRMYPTSASEALAMAEEEDRKADADARRQAKEPVEAIIGPKLHPFKVRTVDEKRESMRKMRRRMPVRTKETNFLNNFNMTIPPLLSPAQRLIMADDGLTVADITAPPEQVEDYMRAVYPPIYPDDELITGEASPAYLFSVRAPSVLLSLFPHGRLVALLRDPVQRAFSRVRHALGLKCDELGVKDVNRHSKNNVNVLPPWCTPRGVFDVFGELASSRLPMLRNCLEEHDFMLYGDERDAPAMEQFASAGKRARLYPQKSLYGEEEGHAYRNRYEAFSKCVVNGTQRLAKGAKDMLNAATGRWMAHQDTAQLNREVSAVMVMESMHRMRVFEESLYAFQVRYWDSFVLPDTMLLVLSEDLYTRTSSVMESIALHVGLKAANSYSPPFVWDSVVSKKYNVASTVPKKKESEAIDAGQATIVMDSALQSVSGSQEKHKGEVHERVGDMKAENATGTPSHPLRANVASLLYSFYAPFNRAVGLRMGFEGSPWVYVPGPHR